LVFKANITPASFPQKLVSTVDPAPEHYKESAYNLWETESPSIEVKNEWNTLSANDYREDLFARARTSLGNLNDRVMKIACKKKGEELEVAVKKVKKSTLISRQLEEE
jgi:hypothetical protein